MRRLSVVGVTAVVVLIVGLLGGLQAAVGAGPAAQASATCSEYSNQAAAQRAADTRDADGDGIYCESLPCPCAGPSGDDPTPEPTPAPTPEATPTPSPEPDADEEPSCRRTDRAVRVRFSRRRWPNLTDHIADVRRAYPSVLHIDRPGADANRRAATRGIPTRRGFDRDEYPPAVSAEGGEGADVRYIRSSENRSAGAYLGNKLRRYCERQAFRMTVSR